MDLEQRMRWLERDLEEHKFTINQMKKQARIYRWIGIVACCGVLLLAVWAAWPGWQVVKRHGVIEAQEFVLKDSSGMVRGRWETANPGPLFTQYDKEGKEHLFLSPGRKAIEAEEFVLRDRAGKKRGEWSVDGRGPKFRLFDENGKLRVALKLVEDSESSAGLFLYDSKEIFRAAIMERSGPPQGSGPNGSMILLNDKSGKSRMFMMVALRQPYLELSDTSGNRRAILQVKKDNTPILAFEDRRGKITWSAPPKSK